jgi:hypothetical protein
MADLHCNFPDLFEWDLHMCSISSALDFERVDFDEKLYC